MLKISFKIKPQPGKQSMIYVDDIFGSNFPYENLTSNLCKEIIKNIDKSEVVSPYLIQSPILGAIPPENLSSGCKCVLLTTLLDEMFVSSRLGDNCVDSLLKVAKTKDIYLSVITDLFISHEQFASNTIYCIDEGREFIDLFDYMALKEKYSEEWYK